MDPNTAGLVGVVVGALGFVAGAIALLYAHKANNLSRDSNQTALDSKELASEANSLAKESNTIAADARQLAEEANTYSHRSEARETERHDVYWEGDWKQPSNGVYRLIKRGSDEAHHVKATVVVDDEDATTTLDLLAEDGAEILFQFYDAASEYRRELYVYREYQRNRRVQGQFGSAVPMPPQSIHRVKTRVEWTTKLNNPMVRELEETTSFSRYYT